MSFRTLRFGDRTISYDAGLNLAQQEDLPTRQNKLISVDPQYDDDGIGTSDDETNSNTSASKTADDLADVDNGNNVTESDQNGEADPEIDPSGIKLSSANLEAKLKMRRVIKPDLTAINRLLAFDEEEEDDCDEDDEMSDAPRPKLKPSQNSGWHKSIARDLAKLTSDRQSNLPNFSSRREALSRRHSITICESRRHRKISNSSSAPSSSSSSGGASPQISLNSGPMSMQPHLLVSPQTSTASSLTSEVSSSSRASPARTDECSLNVNNIQLAPEIEEEDNFDSGKSALKTLNLRLDEVAHIRAALTKAELEAIDVKVREDIERGKVCFLCMKTKFGIFSRGHNCEMCKQLVCARCQSKMRIPLEHFCTTPVFALSPSGNHEESSKRSTAPTANDPSVKYPSLVTPATYKDKKMALPDSLGLLMNNSLQSVGSAPNSPRLSRHSTTTDFPQNGLPTISGVIGYANNNNNNGPVSLPSTAAMITKSPYATLPKKNRRASWMSPLDAEREKLEGVPLTVCNDCKDMVVQVIRVSRSTRRLQMARSAFFSLTPDTFREQRI